jgi:hypothetical protein
MPITRSQLIFTGGFFGFFIKTLPWLMLSILTGGILIPFYVYSVGVYFVRNTILEIRNY